jgi:hypothetical protein
LLSCYSAYGPKWAEWGEKHPQFKGLNIWSLVTIISAVLLIPPMIASAGASPFQFLCFFAPLYLFLVALTPNYQTDKKANLIHQIGAWGCVAMILVWLFVIVKKWVAILPIIVLSLVIGLGTRTFKESWTYYLEMDMFLCTYIILICMFV